MIYQLDFHDKWTFFDLKVMIDKKGIRQYNVGFTFQGTFSIFFLQVSRLYTRMSQNQLTHNQSKKMLHAIQFSIMRPRIVWNLTLLA